MKELAHALPAEALGTERAALVGLLADAGLYPSRGQARKDLPNGSVSINGLAVKDVEYRVSKDDVLPGGVIVLRKTHPDLPRPFKAPGGILLPVLGIISCGCLIAFLPLVTHLRFVGWLLLGMLIYFCYGMHQSKLRSN